MTILVTGGCGFIGSNFIRYLLTSDLDHSIINLDKLTYAGNPANLREFENDPRYVFIKGDICDRALLDLIFRQHTVETVIHFAAESHVDRSIADAVPFVTTNVLGTQTLLDIASKSGIIRFIHISTDEVYGSISQGAFSENDHLHPSSPYSASKAAADLLVHAYYTTHHFPALITRSTNNFGPYQYPEKLIPLFITNILEGKNVPVYGSGANIRDWIYVLDFCRAIDFLSKYGKPGEVYNVSGGNEKTNLEITHTILSLLEKTESWIEYVPDRPGHDFRYALDSTKLRSMGWNPQYPFDQALRETVEWYRKNRWWWEPLKNRTI